MHVTVCLTVRDTFSDTFSLHESQQTRHIFFSSSSSSRHDSRREVEGFAVTHALSALSFFSFVPTVSGARRPSGHTKAVQAITHHGLS